MLIRIPLATGYLGNSLLSHRFPAPKPGKRGSEFPRRTVQGRNIENGSLSLLSANMHVNYKINKNAFVLKQIQRRDERRATTF